MIILHGMPLDHKEMIYEMEPVFAGREGWKRVYVDMPGHGKTPLPDSIANKDGVLKVVEEFIDAVIPNQRFVAAGTSYGGYIARGLVYHRGERMDGLFLNVPSIKPGSQERVLPPRQTVLKNDSIIERARLENSGLLEEVVVRENQTVLDYHRALNACIADEKGLERINGGFGFDVDKLPRPFPAPTLFVTGRQDHWVGYSDAWQIVENYPRATFAVLDGTGHLVRGERPELWISLVKEWLDRVEEWIAKTQK